MRKGELIRKERERKGLSQEQLADLIGVTRVTVTKYETGASTIPDYALRAICRELRSPRLRLQVLGGAIPCYYLDKVDTTPAVAAQKAIEEMEEALECLKRLDLINKNSPDDLSRDEKKRLLTRTMMELQDVNVCMDVLLVTFAERYDIDLTELDEMSKSKMVTKGYASDLVMAT